MKITLTHVFIKEQVSARTNKPYTSLSLKTTEYGDRYLSGFGSKETMNWKAGDVVEVDVTESDKMDKTGKPYLNWKLPKQMPPAMLEIEGMKTSIARLKFQVGEIEKFIKHNFTNDGKPAYKGPNFGDRVETPEEHAQQTKALDDLSQTYHTKNVGEMENLEAVAEAHFATDEWEGL